MKRLYVVPIVVMFLMTAFVPASSAADASVVFLGQGQADALKLSVPLLNILPTQLPLLGDLSKGLTVGHVENTFEGLTPNQSKGLAAGVCSLLGNALLSVPATSGTLPGTLPSLPALPGLSSLPCSGTAKLMSDSTANNGNTTPTCMNELNIAVLDLKTACAQSFSAVTNGRPVGQNNAGVADLNISLGSLLSGNNLLDLNTLLGTLGLSGITGSGSLPVVGPLVSNTVGGLVPGLLGPLLGNATGGTGQVGGLIQPVTSLLQGVLGQAGSLLDVRLGMGSTVLSNNGAASQEVSHAAGATVGILANLIQITVGEATSKVIWNDTTGQATAHADPALAHLIIGNPLNLTGSPLLDLPINLSAVTDLLHNIPVAGGLLSGLLISNSNGCLVVLGGTPLQTSVCLATASPDASGVNVTAQADGLTIKALQGLGAKTPSSMDGGIILSLASSSASVAGNIAKIQTASAPLPITGGRSYVFLAGAGILAVGAAQMLRGSRKLRAKSNA